MKRSISIFVIHILGASLIFCYNFLKQRGKEAPVLVEEGVYKIGGVTVDKERGEIRFSGKVQKCEGWVQFLIYLQGYKWLKDESAILSEARLIDLQNGIALLDWKLWDELWYGKTSNQKSETRNQNLLLFLKWDEEEISAKKLILTEDRLEMSDLIFLGSPYFDPIVLEAPRGIDCASCSIFPLEEKALRKEFVRELGRSGYELNSEVLPEEGTEVTIIVKRVG